MQEIKTQEDFNAIKALYVKNSKRLLQAIDLYQFQIAEMAFRICDIRHGGSSTIPVYTLKDFAQEINLNRKTLSGWVEAYRFIILKGEIAIDSLDDWRAATKTNNLLSKNRAANGNKGKKKNYKGNLTKEEVRSLYDPIRAGEKPFQAEVLKLISSAKHITTTLKTRDLSIASTAVLLNLMEELDRASDILNEHLTQKMNERANRQILRMQQ